MAIFEEKAYGAQCDVCGIVYMNEYSGFSLWVDTNSVKEEIQDDYWLVEDGKCYCPKCYDIDDNDVVTIKKKDNEKERV